MKRQVLTRRYGLGLINALKNEEDFRRVRADLAEAAAFMLGPGKLRDLLASPFRVKGDKVKVVGDILKKGGADVRVRNFLLLLLDKGRFELLPDILELLPRLWNDRMGIVTIEAVSAVPLSDPQKSALQQALASREGRPVSLSYHVDPELVGGLSLRKGNEVLDLSLKGRLARLREILSEN